MKRGTLITVMITGAVALLAGTAALYVHLSKPAALSSSSTTSRPSQSSSSGTESSSSPSSTLSSSSASSGTGEKLAYLTFDDGPSRLTPGLLDVLAQNNVKATFFVIAGGKDTPQRRAWMKQVTDSGNEIGIHSFTHDYQYIYKNEQNFLTDLDKITNMIEQATGKKPVFMRFPGGIGNTVSISACGGKVIMPTLLKDVEQRGITTIDWNAGGEDAVSHVPTKEELLADITKDSSGLKNVVILLHDSEGHQSSIDAVPQIVSTLRAKGYTFALLGSATPAIQQKPAMSSSKFKHPVMWTPEGS